MMGARATSRLKVFLSYAAGVGKTYQLLVDGHRLKRRGVDVVIAFFNPHAYGRPDTDTLTAGLEQVPPRTTMHGGVRFDDMDTEAVLRRRPEVALVDELPHTNRPGAARAKRWQDMQVLLESRIDVVTTMNVTHLESLNEQIWQLAGVRMRELVPDHVLTQADEIVMVDIPPRELLRRLQRGVIYPPGRARVVVGTLFKASTLATLRELAMRYASHVVQTKDAADDPPDPSVDAGRDSSSDGLTEAGGERATGRLLLVIEPHPASAALLERARRVREASNAECFAVFVARHGDLRHLTPGERDTVERQLSLARGLHMESRILEGDDTAATLVDFARLQDVTHILVLRHASQIFRRNLVRRIVHLAPDIEVLILSASSNRAGILC